MQGWRDMSEEQQREETLAFLAWVQEQIPGCQVRFKDDPPQSMPWQDRLMHAVARLLTPEYDTRYTTVLHPRIYFPSGMRPIFEQAPQRFYVTLRHEYVHLRDFQRFGLLMGLSYIVLLPTVWTMRAFWELRGYTQNMICEFERTGDISDDTIARITSIFTGRGYFYMALPRRRIQSQLLRLREEILQGQLSGPYPYDNSPKP